MCFVPQQLLTHIFALIVNGDGVTRHVYGSPELFIVICKLLPKLRNATNHTNNNKFFVDICLSDEI